MLLFFLLSSSPDDTASVHFPCLPLTGSGACLVLLWSLFVLEEILSFILVRRTDSLEGVIMAGVAVRNEIGPWQVSVGSYQEGRMVEKGNKH